MHEPFTDCYYFSRQRKSRRYGDRPESYHYGPAEAVASVFSRSAPVIFVKDLCFQAEPYVPQEFLETSINTFIVRSPEAVLASLAPLKPDFSEDEFGFLPLAKMWHRITGTLGRDPIVVEGDIFRADPELVLRLYCERIGIEFDPRMLNWKDGRIREWLESERESQAKWHHTLERSTNILPPNPSRPEATISVQSDIYDSAWEIYDEVSKYALGRGYISGVDWIKARHTY